MKRLLLVLLTLGLAGPSASLARDFSKLYPAAELERVGAIYAPNIEGMLFQDIARYLRDDELETLRRVRIWQPRDRTVDPFEFFASSDDGVIVVPTLSVKFFDDLAVAIAWFEDKGCRKEAIFDYVAALDYSDLVLDQPHRVLGVPPKAWEQSAYVDDVSQKALKSAIAFIVLHELGHVHHGHRGYDGITAAEARAQEREADRFAMRVLRRMHLPPLGVALWFMAVSLRDPLVPGSPRQTHPLSSDRMRSIAGELRRRPGDFIEPLNRGRIDENAILGVANDIDGIGTMLADPDLRSFVRQRGRSATPELLASGCRAEQLDDAWLRRFRELLE